MRRIIQRYQEGGVVQAGSTVGANTGADGYNSMDMQAFVDNNSANRGGPSSSSNNQRFETTFPMPEGFPHGQIGPMAARPTVATGIPQGGHAKQAIADYLAGKSLGDPLSYVDGESNVPDYRDLADKLGPRFGSSQPDAVAGVAVEDGNTEHSDMMAADSSGQIETLGGGVINYSNAGEKQHAENIAKIIADGGVDKDGQPNISSGPNVLSASDVGLFGIGDTYGQQFQENYDAQSVHAANNPEFGQSTGTPLYEQGFYDNFITDYFNNSMVGRVGKYFTGNEMFPGLLPPDSVVGEGETYMEQLDAFGGAGPAIESDNSIVDHTPTRILDTSGGTQTTDGLTFDNTYTGGYSAGDHPTNQGGSTARKEAIQAGIDRAARDAAIAKFGSEQLWLNAGSPMNNGGSVGPLAQRYNNGSPGGVTTAKSGIREEEIRERQRMQARLPDVKASPVSGIGERLAMGAVNNGINTGLATMAGKEGLMGTLGTMMGSGGGAVAGTGMMSALGPIGIGIGLGKMFGLFNDGGKVPCSCGKTPCKCAKRKKSPLSGE